MKKIVSVLALLLSFSSFATIEYDVFENNCYVEVMQPIVLLHSSASVQVGSILLNAKRIDRNNTRQLSPGRIIQVQSTDQYNVRFFDNALKSMCLVISNTGMCMDIRFVDASDIETFSYGALRMFCESKQIVEM